MGIPFDDFLDALESAGSKVKRRGDKAKAQCLAHDDKMASLSVKAGDDGRVLVRCFAGCDVSAIAASVRWEVKDLFPHDDDGKRGKRAPMPVTVEALAANKKLPVEFLRSLGLRDEGNYVVIPYLNLEGEEVARKHRTALKAKEGSFWQGEGGIYAYGVWRLADARKRRELVLVEGESDCWTHWHHGFPALGLPGADSGATLYPEYLNHIDRIFIVREPDKGGDTFVEGISKRLASYGWKGTARVVRFPAAKDTNDLHRQDPEKFVKAFAFALATSIPITDAMAVYVDTTPDDTLEAEVAALARKRSFSCDDIGNAQRFSKDHHERTRWTASHDWMVWDGKRWVRAKRQQIEQWAITTVDAIPGEMKHAETEGQKEEVWKHARRSRSKNALRAMIDLARAMPGVAISEDVWDRSVHMLTVRNGCVDLRTGRLLAHDPKVYSTHLAPVAYEPQAPCPNWLAFLDQVMAGKEDLISFLRRAVGYTLTGSCQESCLFINYGTGANGKSTFIETLRAVLGDYAASTAFDTFMVKGNDAIRNDIARLAGIRYVTASEAEAGASLSESTVKSMTGQDRISARFLRQEYFEFEPQFKAWLSVNHLPSIRSSDHGIRRRMCLVPWTVTFKVPDKTLRERLLQELPGILAWAVQGAVEWYRSGLRAPASVTDATQEYLAEQDVIGQFLDEATVRVDTAEVVFADLYIAYSIWCKEVGERAWTRKRFGVALSERHIDRCLIGETSAKGRKGIALHRGWEDRIQKAKGGDRWWDNKEPE